MRKIFISQPMNGKSEEEIRETRNRAIENAIGAAKKYFKYDPELEVEIINSFFEDYDPDNGSVPLKYLAKSLDKLADADLAYFCRGWGSARGCIIEHHACVAYGIQMIHES